MTAARLGSIMRDQVALSISSFDRLYLGGYVPRLQTGGQLTTFCREQLGAPIPSPALFRPLHDRFVATVHTFAAQHRIRIVRFERGQRKDELAAWYRARFQASHGVVFIGIAQEKASAFKAQRVVGEQGGVWFEFSRQSVAVNHVYFYVQDAEWGPAFVKVGTYLPYPVRMCLNGHEWAKQQLCRAGIAFTALANGFRWCADPPRLQQVCDALGPAEVQAFFDRWVAQLPWPLDARLRAAGYAHRLSLWQVEVSLTQVFREPLWGRRCFEAIIRDNLDLGRPDRVSLVFGAKLTRATPPPRFGYRTRVLTRGVQPSLHVDFKSSHLKQYLKEGWALRTETTFNDLETEHLANAAVPEPSVCARIQRPQLVAGQRVPALRLSDGRVLALLQALCQVAPRPDGFRHRDLRPLVAGLLGRDLEHYSAGAMTYDLRRLRHHGLIERQPHSFRYLLTPDGLHLAFGFSRIVLRLLQPSWTALLLPCSAIPAPLREALTRLDAALADLLQAA